MLHSCRVEKEKEYTTIYKEIGDKLKKIRIEAGYTSYENFANEFELDRKQYWRIESGQNVTLKSLIKILRIHNLTIQQFFIEL